MKLGKTGVKRLAIYFFYDKYGIVDDYIIYFLASLKKSCEDIIFVSNGKLKEDSLVKLNKISGMKICERENKGFDVWAYIRGFEEVGWENIRKYDEVIMANFTIMGPVYPFSEMFNKMNGKDVDFWGITEHLGAEVNPYSDEPEKKEEMPTHLQSHFIAVRNSMLKDKRFYDYFKNMPMINKYADSVYRHESRFTKYFGDLGFKYLAYVDSNKYRGISSYPLMYMPIDLIETDRCPIFKRKAFFLDMPSVLCETKNSSRELMDFLKNKTDYDTDLIWQNILRTSNLSEIVYSMDLWYEIDNTPVPAKESDKPYAILTVVNKKEHLALVKDYFNKSGLDKSKIIVLIPKDLSSKTKKELKDCGAVEYMGGKLPVKAIKNKLGDFKYCCLINLADHSFVDTKVVEDKFNLDVLNSLIGSQSYIQNVIDLFEREKRLGVLIPTNSLHSMYSVNVGGTWQKTYDVVKKYLNDNDINVEIDKKIEPISANAGSFWFRSDALSDYLKTDLCDYNKTSKFKLKFSDYIKPFDNLCPLLSQNNGFYTAYVMSKEISEEQVRNLSYFVAANNRYLREKSSRKITFKSYVYFKVDGVYKEKGKVEYKTVYDRKKQNSLRLNVEIKEDCGEFRFDMAEYVGCICEGTRLKTNGQTADVNIDLNGGYRVRGLDVFFDTDPFYVFKGSFKKGEIYTVIIPKFSLIMAEKDSIDSMRRDLVPTLHSLNTESKVLRGDFGLRNKLELLFKALFNKLN